MIIKLIRHGESEANAGNVNPTQVKDAAISLSETGKKQALELGRSIEQSFVRDALVYCSPYQRTRQTLQHLIQGSNTIPSEIEIFEDPRLREIDIGYDAPEEQLELRKTHGWFYYRFKGGESPADTYDRTSAFIESMMRQISRSKKHNILIVCHGMTLRCFVARFLHLAVEEFESMHNPNNCDIVTIAKKELIQAPTFSRGRWAVEGLNLRSPL